MTLRPAFRVVLAALAFPAFTLAETVTSGTLMVAGTNSHNGSSNVINAYDCTGTDPDGNEVLDYITVSWTGVTQFAPNDSMRIDVSNKTGCPPLDTSKSEFTAPLVEDPFPSNGATDQWPRSGDTANRIKASELVAKIPSGAGISCSAGTTQTIYVCVVDLTPSPPLTLTGTITLNTTTPSAPTLQSVESSNSGLYASWTSVSGTSITYKIRATAVDTTQDGTTHDSGPITGTTGRIGGLTNGVTYSVVVFAFNSADNRSEPSSAVEGTPVKTDDFWDRYHQAGGVEEGGCSAGSAGALAPLLLLAALWLRRRP